MRLLPNLRFGTERYPEKVARRLRRLNIATWVAAATHAFYALVLFFYPTLHWLSAGNAVAALLYAGIPLLHRLGSLAGPVAGISLLYADIFVYISLLGIGIGIQFYYLLGVALTVLYIGTEHVALASASGAVAATLIVILQLTVPYDTGVIPEPLVWVSIVTNAIVSCGLLIVIVSYALRQAARAEATAERGYERSERLLTNILPSPIAARLKDESNVVIPDRYNEASILFADMAGFTAQASETAPRQRLLGGHRARAHGHAAHLPAGRHLHYGVLALGMRLLHLAEDHARDVGIGVSSWRSGSRWSRQPPCYTLGGRLSRNPALFQQHHTFKIALSVQCNCAIHCTVTPATGRNCDVG